jgi:hypothetical protein
MHTQTTGIICGGETRARRNDGRHRDHIGIARCNPIARKRSGDGMYRADADPTELEFRDAADRPRGHNPEEAGEEIMFTVKYVAPSGEETISECQSVVADRTEHDARPRVLIFDETPTLAKDNNVGMYVGQDEDCGSEPHDGIVYVMNRHGATVGTYRL